MQKADKSTVEYVISEKSEVHGEKRVIQRIITEEPWTLATGAECCEL